MDTVDACKEFMVRTGAEVNEEQLRAMLCREAEDAIQQYAHNKRSGAWNLRYDAAVEVALDRMVQWWQTASERTDSPAHLVGTMRPAAAWVVLTWREQHAATTPEE